MSTDCSYFISYQFIHVLYIGHISRQMLEEALSRFHGEILQTPPLYSALKLHGCRIADLTR